MAFTKVVGAGIHTLSNITSHNIHSSGIVTATKFDGPFDNLNVTGITTFAGSVSIGGTLTYEDVTNIDSVGLVTARDGIFIPDNKKLEFGNAAGSGDLQIYHESSSHKSIIKESGASGFHFQGSNIVFDNTAGNKRYLNMVDGGSVSLYFNTAPGGAAKLETTNTGVTINGTAIATLFSGASQIGIQSAGTQIGAGITQLNFVGTGNTFAVNGTTVDISIAGGGGGTGAGGTWSTYTAGIATTKSVGVNTNNLDDNDLVGVGNSFQGLYISNGMMIMDNTLNGNHYIGTTMNGLMAGPVNIEGTLTVDGNYVVV
tara:strand:- start:99 stop:1040 length:942 start_codon:yes stop_codon:yes gene_type:complete